MKLKAFTLVEIMVIIAIMAMIIVIVIPPIKALYYITTDKEIPKTVEQIEQDAEIIQIENDLVAVDKNKTIKIEIKPAFHGKDVKVYLTNLPDNSRLIYNNGKTYLFWIPQKSDITKTTIITAAGELKETYEIKLIVR
jgi:competence protein ComGC